MSKQTIMECHKQELRELRKMKRSGVKEVRHVMKFVKVSDHNNYYELEMIPIEEAINSWSDSIKAMTSGEPQEQFNY